MYTNIAINYNNNSLSDAVYLYNNGTSIPTMRITDNEQVPYYGGQKGYYMYYTLK